ncbi:hypothetical protein N0V90_005580 [Kalmusia sp. IMI 367209]|nr:hypothetical protein N0V90_005580 [Kalmusia sp. IMI 367209]
MSSLTANYTSPSSSESFTHNLPTVSANPTTPDRTAYLSALQSSVKTLQTDINTFLTQKMEADKAAGEKGADAKEEENYGEEIMEGE